MIQAGILGATGYAGVELTRLLLRHPGAQVAATASISSGPTPACSRACWAAWSAVRAGRAWAVSSSSRSKPNPVRAEITAVAASSGSGLSGAIGGGEALTSQTRTRTRDESLAKWTKIAAVLFFVVTLAVNLFGVFAK